MRKLKHVSIHDPSAIKNGYDRRSNLKLGILQRQVEELCFCYQTGSERILIFVPKQNTIYERYVFNCRSQKPGESFDQFLTELCKFATTCQFSAFEDEILRDRIVTGL